MQTTGPWEDFFSHDIFTKTWEMKAKLKKVKELGKFTYLRFS